MSKFFIFIIMTKLQALILLILATGCSLCHGALYSFVTCGSVIKLQNARQGSRLHSHEVQYGSGSGQQSVTAIEDVDDVNSHWVIKGIKEKPCPRGEPILCGQNIRLEHLMTKRNLHSHLFAAPLSRGQEVSAFGKDGEGDTGDNWMVLCDDDKWLRDSEVMLKHLDTSMYLAISGQTFGHPIPGQMEVYAVNYVDASTSWKVNEGIFIKPSELPQKVHQHTEL